MQGFGGTASSVHDEVTVLRNRVMELEDRVQYLYNRLNIQYAPPVIPQSNVDPRVLAAIKKGNTMEAIKILREITNCSLTDAKLYIERITSGL